MSKFSLCVNEILKLIHLDSKVAKTFLLLCIKIKMMFAEGSSKVFNNALSELMFKNSILSIKTNLGLSLNEDLLRLLINFLI